MELVKKNVAILATCQAMLFAANSALAVTAGLAGYALATNKSFATFPVTAWVLGAAVTVIPASLLMKRLGRRAGFYIGTLVGALGAGLGALALYSGNFWLLCVAMVGFGSYNGFAQYYRFAAADAAAADFKSTAISLVLAGGLVGGLIGPQLSNLTVDLFPTRYLGTYLSLLIYAAAVMLALTALRIPIPSEAEQTEVGRPLTTIAAQPAYIVAVVGAALGFGVMNFLMVATPIAMGFHGHHYESAAFVIQWHVIAMFAPSFVTGGLIKRFGVLNVMFAGVLMLAGCVAIALAGIAVANFWFALVLLGIGWNFLYIGGTTLLTETYQPAERAKAQGFNDLILFLTQAVTSLASGWLLERGGWVTINYMAMPMIIVVAVALGWLLLKRRLAPTD